MQFLQKKMVNSVSGWLSASQAALLQKALCVFLAARAVLMTSHPKNEVGQSRPISPESGPIIFSMIISTWCELKNSSWEIEGFVGRL